MATEPSYRGRKRYGLDRRFGYNGTVAIIVLRKNDLTHCVLLVADAQTFFAGCPTVFAPILLAGLVKV